MDFSSDVQPSCALGAEILESLRTRTALLLEQPEEEDEPYFGWCDVAGCQCAAGSGGSGWRKSGYWRLCSKHILGYRDGEPQPKMKASAILREALRGADGCLPIQV